MPSGGYRKPAHPAPVSGPGALSKRTDGQPLRAGDKMGYGNKLALLRQEAGAPMAQGGMPTAPPPISAAAPPPASAPDAQPAAPYAGMDFMGPSQRPGEPVTHGVDIGTGGGSEHLPVQAQPQFTSQGPMAQMLAQLSAGGGSGVLAQLYQSAVATGA